MSSSSSTWLSAVALVAVLLFVALISLQLLELMHYRADPSLWPVP